VSPRGAVLALLAQIAADDGAFDAMAEVILQHLGLDPRQRRANRLQLGQDVDAIAVLFHHPGDTTHLALDAAQAVEQFGLVVLGQGASSGSWSYTRPGHG
jgi:hypothetical protein